MIQDMGLTMSDKQAITTLGANDSESIIDNIKGGDPGKPLFWVVKVDESFTTSASGTLAGSLQTAAASSYAELQGMNFAATAVASLTAGTIVVKRQMPYGLLRNLKTVFTVGTGAMTGGKVSSFLTTEPDNF